MNDSRRTTPVITLMSYDIEHITYGSTNLPARAYMCDDYASGIGDRKFDSKMRTTTDTGKTMSRVRRDAARTSKLF